jgi:glycosyltransferase involved in cell wall biosynthesis
MSPPAGGRGPRLLFCSYHCYLDPASGAAQCTRDLLTLLAARGWTCAALSGPHLDCGAYASAEQVLRAHAPALSVRPARIDGREYPVFQLVDQGVAVSVLDGRQSRPPDEPAPDEGEAFLTVLEGALDQLAPDLVLTYGGHWLAREAIARVKRRGVPVVFALHNFAYHDADLFRPVDAVLVPSEFARRHYREALGLDSTALPGPWDWARLRCPEVAGRYATFVNPEPNKGLYWFARLAEVLGRRRPDIPLLVVDGRGRAEWLGLVGIDFSRHRNLHRLPNTPDPRAFYRLSRVLLMPSLWRESYPRLAVEACMNGIPVLASRRGGLPETLARAGLLLDIPERYQPETRLLPSEEEVTPWVELLARLWDDHDFYESERRRALDAAEEWRPERLLPRFEAFFEGVLRRSGRRPHVATPAPAAVG